MKIKEYKLGDSNIEVLKFREKVKYIINNFIDLENNNIFKNEGVYNQLKNIGIQIITLRKDEWNIDYDNFELELIKNTTTIILFVDNIFLTRFYLKEDFSIVDSEIIPNCIYQELITKYMLTDDNIIYIYQYIIEYIEEIYEKLKENEEIKKDLNLVENTTQRKRVKI